MKKILLVIGLALAAVITSVGPVQAHHPTVSTQENYYVNRYWDPFYDMDSTQSKTQVWLWYDSNRPISSSWYAPLIRAVNYLNSRGGATPFTTWYDHNVEIVIKGDTPVSAWNSCPHTPSSTLQFSILIGRVYAGTSGNYPLGMSHPCIQGGSILKTVYVALNGDLAGYWHTADTDTPVGKINMEGTFLHELVHALGFSGGPGQGHFEHGCSLEAPHTCGQDYNHDLTICDHLGGAQGDDPFVPSLPASAYQTMCSNSPWGTDPNNLHHQYMADIQDEQKTLGLHDSSALRRGYMYWLPSPW